MISGQAPAVSINLDGVRSEIASIKKETDDIKDALKEQGEQLQDIKVIVSYVVKGVLDLLTTYRHMDTAFYS